MGSYNPDVKDAGLGWSVFARRYLRNRILFLFLCLLRCFNSAGLAYPSLFYSGRNDTIQSYQVTPFRNLRVKRLFAPKPKLIAAYHVFHRLLAPRHPLYALNNLIPHSLEIGFCYISRWLLRHQFCLESEQIIADSSQP